MTHTPPRDILDAPDVAREIVSIYDLLLNRNPDAAEFHEGMLSLLSGIQRDEFFRQLAGTDEASERFLNNPNFGLLINRLLDSTGQRTGIQRKPHIAWKAEHRPLCSDDPVSIMQIELTNECPFRCVMCPRTKHMTRATGRMDFHLFRKIIDELATIRPDYARTQPPIWLHHFGESLIHPQFGEFIRYAKSHGIPTAMSINPLMLNERISAELLDAEPQALYLSLDGHDDASFERIRGIPRAYEKSRQRLLRFLEHKVDLGVKTHMTLSVIDFVLNGDEGSSQRVKLENYWRAVPGVDEFLWKAYGTFSGEIARINELACPSEAVQIARRYKDVFRVTCDFPWRRMVVTWTGSVVPCCHDYDVKMPLGDLRTQSLEEIWNGEKMLALRQELISGEIANPVCRDCEHRYKNNPRDE
ncbi:MAG: radical SAM/SPASM domain-containing protein [Betaproteobacteria bacterium]|nr:radical SAM/SPASM domain-containing protein [Betaproteobacteria bacterium]